MLSDALCWRARWVLWVAAKAWLKLQGKKCVDRLAVLSRDIPENHLRASYHSSSREMIIKLKTVLSQWFGSKFSSLSPERSKYAERLIIAKKSRWAGRASSQVPGFSREFSIKKSSNQRWQGLLANELFLGKNFSAKIRLPGENFLVTHTIINYQWFRCFADKAAF